MIKELQSAILANMNGQNWVQLNLFPSNNDGMIRVPIRLKDITKPYSYKEAYTATLELSRLSIRLPSNIGKDYICIATLFPRVELPKMVNGKSIMYVELFTSAARKLIEIDKTGSGKPGFFTKYLYEVAMNARCKYTYKIYMIICSWKSKGGFRITLDELKERLGLNKDEYKEYREFKKRILLPVQKDLQNKSDCWFNCAADDFEQRKNNKVIFLNFKIIIPAPVEVINERIDHIKYLLRTHFDFQQHHIAALKDFFNSINDVKMIEEVLLKIQDLNGWMVSKRGTKHQVEQVQLYVIKSLKNHLK